MSLPVTECLCILLCPLLRKSDVINLNVGKMIKMQQELKRVNQQLRREEDTCRRREQQIKELVSTTCLLILAYLCQFILED